MNMIIPCEGITFRHEIDEKGEHDVNNITGDKDICSWNFLLTK